MIRIVVAEDVSMTRIGLVSMINEIGADRFVVVGEADNGQTALELILAQRPDVVFTDIRMPVMGGIELMERVRKLGREVCFVALSAYNDYEYVRRAMLLGAEDYLLKLDVDHKRLTELLNALHRKLRGEPTAGQTELSLCSEAAAPRVGLEDLDALLARILRALNRLDLDEVNAAFDALRQQIARSDAEISLQVLYGTCYTLIYMVSRFNSEHQVHSSWNRSRQLNLLMQQCHTTSQYISYIETLQEHCRALLAGRREHNEICTAMQYMRDNLARDLSLDDIAGQVNLNPSYFSRLFAKEAGKSCIDYLTEIRIQRAMELLLQTEDRISDISDRCGYHSQYYFSRTFKKATGLSPMEWRKKQRG